MNEEEIWTKYATAALMGIVVQSEEDADTDAESAGAVADAMLAEHLERFGAKKKARAPRG